MQLGCVWILNCVKLFVFAEKTLSWMQKLHFQPLKLWFYKRIQAEHSRKRPRTVKTGAYKPSIDYAWDINDTSLPKVSLTNYILNLQNCDTLNWIKENPDQTEVSEFEYVKLLIKYVFTNAFFYFFQSLWHWQRVPELFFFLGGGGGGGV